ncbi:BppU family phage baseplate upper protein [Ligilactobacillus salivarius]|uniref:BppU family phage baseplate upper protein n=1 Tax=Ligilactobacillus salivarius TaxID=1624 RepID=UPI003F1EB810
MAQTLKYVIGKDYRPLTVLEAKGGNTFSPDYDKENWVQARQYEDSLRQVFVEITNEDGSAYDLTGANVLFEGILPDNEHKILDNSHVVFYEDPTTGKFRFDMPAQAFSVAGQYKQAFFRVVKDYRNIATLEFKFEVLADIVVTGLVPRDYISPLDDLFNTIKETEIKNVAELKKIVDEKINEITDLMTTLNQTNTATLSELNAAKTALEALEEKIKQDGLFTQAEADAFKQAIVQIIKTNTINVFDSVDDMKHNASSLVDGMKVRTLSYYDNPADPYGGCLYKVRTTKTTLPAVDLGNGLYAVPILEHSRVMNAACFGIKVNSGDDQADAIQTFLNSVPYNYKAYFPAGSYVLEHGIKIPGNREIFGDTTNILNASWNGTGFFFKNLAENTVAIDAHADGKQTVRNLWVQIEGAYTFEEDRTKSKITTDNKMVSPFTITKSTSGIVGIYIGGYGSIAKDNVVVGASEAGIDSDAFCQIRDNQVWDSSIGIRTKSDMQISGNRVQHCEFGIQLNGAECNVVNERYDSISEMGYLLNQAHGSNLVNVQVDYCGGPGILLNNTSNCHISTQIGRTGIYYAGTEADDLASPTFAAGIVLTGSSSYNRIDITQDYGGIFDSGTPDVRAPRYKVVTGQYYDAADTHAYHNDITLSGGGLDVQPGTKLTVDQLKRFMFIAGEPNHVMFSGSLNIYGTTYYYNTIDSTYDVGVIKQAPVIGYNDTTAITLNTLTLKKTIHSDEVISNNMDSLTITGIYSWNGYAMSKSANLPPEKDIGVLLVMNTNDKITQFIMGGG